MKSDRLKKLFFSGVSNFNGDLILKISVNNSDVSLRSGENCLVISNKNFDTISEDNISAYKALIILNEVNAKEVKGNNKIVFLNENPVFNDGDIVEIICCDKKAKVVVLYRPDSDDNTLVMTSACNNKCIMCPEPIVRESSVNFNLNMISKLISLIDKKTLNLGITGGEPTLIKQDLVKILSLCRKRLPNTQLSLITNGRMFSYKSFVDAVKNVNNKRLLFCIPLNSHDEKIHDEITEVKGSFLETCNGIKNLLSESQLVELRIVIQKKNYRDLEKIANFIINNFFGVYRVVFIGMEVSGMARFNIKNVWVKYDEVKASLEKALILLLDSGVKTNVFNIPLCKISLPFRRLVANSISDYKIRFLSDCENCSEKKLCGGCFVSTIDLIKKEGVKPINETTSI